MAALVEAAGNLAFQLIMNSVREFYLPHADAFAAVVARRQELAPLYARTAEAVHARQGDAAAAAITELAAAQWQQMAAAPLPPARRRSARTSGRARHARRRGAGDG